MTKKILGIGNAIVDILSKIDDNFLTNNSLMKGSMSLIDEASALKLSEINFEKITSGGSAGNTIAALAQLGCKTSFIGKVGDDNFGQKFIEEIEKTGTEFLNKTRHQNASARSFILVSKDAQRTMCTFLGCASAITEEDILEEDFRDVGILYLEGYLWDAPSTILALKKAISYAKKYGAKIAFTSSDSFCVSRHKKDFLQLIENDLDILFSNEDEASELVSSSQKEWSLLTKDLQNLFIKNKNLTAVVTRSEKGCAIFEGEKIYEIKTTKVESLIDTTGAGDVFAAGFLYGINNDLSLEKSGEIGNHFAAKIIQKFGARFEEEEIKAVKIS